MKDTSLRHHLTIAGQLPDYVLGKLDETSLRRVSKHLEDCASCRREVSNAMIVLGLLAPIPPPPARARAALLERAAAIRPAATPGEVAVAPRALPAPPQRHEPSGNTGRRWWRPWRQHVLGNAVAAAAVVLLSGLLGWSYQQHRSSDQQESIPAVTDEALMAFPLDDSDLSATAAGVVFAEPRSHEVYLVANGLPVLPRDQRYQVWLFTVDDEQESAGLLAVDAEGDLRATLQTPDPFVDYVGVALTAEPIAGSAFPTSDLVLGGSFPPVLAAAESIPA